MERLAFDKHGDPKDYQQLVVQIQKGKLIPVYPPNRAAGKPIYPMSSQGKGSSEP
jgi:branched-chain amino acid transport system substrate-binding protein